jgi:hypothetical protein
MWPTLTSAGRFAFLKECYGWIVKCIPAGDGDMFYGTFANWEFAN